MMKSLSDFRKEVEDRNYVLIELGCGPNKRTNGLGIDLLPLKGVDYVANLEEGLPFLVDNSVDEIFSHHVLEHIENFEFLMKEIHRVLKPNGKKVLTVPHFSNPYFYSDYTHKAFFGLYSFDYFGNGETMLRRKVPNFYSNIRFEVAVRKLVFKAPYFLVRHTFRRKVLQRIFNISPFFQELYEGSLCYIFPCYELYFELKPIK